MSASFGAPWSAMLKNISIGGSAILLGIPVLAGTSVPTLGGSLGLLILGGPLAIWIGSLLFIVRGYEIASGELLVRRLLWSTRIPLDGLRQVEFDPTAVQGSLRLFGNGGLFSFSGWFRNQRLGRYRAYLTDHQRAVVLTWGDRKVAISPDRPQDLVELLRRRLPGSA